MNGEVLQQRDLLVREWTHLLPVDHEVAKKRLILAQRHRDQRAASAQLDKSTAERDIRPGSTVHFDIRNRELKASAPHTAKAILHVYRSTNQHHNLPELLTDTSTL